MHSCTLGIGATAEQVFALAVAKNKTKFTSPVLYDGGGKHWIIRLDICCIGGYSGIKGEITMKPKPFTKADFENNVGLNFFVATKRDVYEGEIIDANDKHLTIERFDRVKDENRELDIPYGDILWAKEDI